MALVDTAGEEEEERKVLDKDERAKGSNSKRTPPPRDEARHLFIFGSKIWWLRVKKFEGKKSPHKSEKDFKLPLSSWCF